MEGEAAAVEEQEPLGREEGIEAKGENAAAVVKPVEEQSRAVEEAAPEGSGPPAASEPGLPGGEEPLPAEAVVDEFGGSEAELEGSGRARALLESLEVSGGETQLISARDERYRAALALVTASEEPAGGERRPEEDDLARARELLAMVEAKTRGAESGGPTKPAETATPAAPRVETDSSGGVANPTATEPPPPPKNAGGAPEGKEGAAKTTAGEGGAEKPVTRGAEEGSSPAAPARPPRPPGEFLFKTMFHKTANELIDFLRQYYPEWIEKGHVVKVEGKSRTVVIFGEKPGDPNDPLIQKIARVVDYFDDLELKVESRVIRPRYAPLDIVMDALVMRGLANVWHLIEETDTLSIKEGNKTRTFARKRPGYIKSGLVQGATAPVEVAPKIPYVYELPTQDSFQIPPIYSALERGAKTIVNFDKTSSTEERNAMVAVGTKEDLERIQAFVDSIDVPAKRIMIEIQVIELEANKLLDYGFDSLQFGGGHHIGNLALPLPGEPLRQPGLGEDVRRDPEAFVPPVVAEGFEFIYDDTSIDLSGRFLTTLHALVREGEAKVKARPKILTLDDRVSVLHLGREVPTFKSTGVTRDSVNGNLVSEVREVTTEYVGITLNIRPRVTGDNNDEVSLQIELIANELGERQRVFEEDLLGIPTVVRRHYVGENRVKNHRPIILGGLIQESEAESVNKIPLLADIPLLGYLFRRTQNAKSRREIILVVTPHILSDRGVDRAATPKESIHFDTFDSVLFNDRHIIKGSDVLGVDPINNAPARGPDGRLFTEDEVIDLTLLNIVKKRELVSKLNILEDYLGEEAEELSWIQRRWPEATVDDWPEREQELFYRAAAIVIDNIKELNPDLTFEELVLPRREIILPSSPYRISLSYDRVKALQTLGSRMVFRGERVELDQGVVTLLRDAGGRSLLNFADFLERRGRTAEDHGEMLVELKRLYAAFNPGSNALEGIPYPDVYRELNRAKLDFVSLATFFQANLEERYKISGPPDIGLFAQDLKDFLQTSVSLVQRARKLKELERKWRLLTTEEGEEADRDAGR